MTRGLQMFARAAVLPQPGAAEVQRTHGRARRRRAILENSIAAGLWEHLKQAEVNMRQR